MAEDPEMLLAPFKITAPVPVLLKVPLFMIPPPKVKGGLVAVFVNEVPELIVNKPVKVLVPAVVPSFIDDVPFRVVVPAVVKLVAFKFICPEPFKIVLPFTIIVAAADEPVNVPFTVKLPVTVIVPTALLPAKVPFIVKSPLIVIEFELLNVNVPPVLMVKLATLIELVFKVTLCPLLIITLVPVEFGTTAGDHVPVDPQFQVGPAPVLLV
jgi:hypothetical protein